MPLNFNIGLPGPFSYSVRVTPSICKTVRQVDQAARTLAERERRCSCPQPVRSPAVVRREAPQFYEPVEPSSIPPTPRFVRVLWVLALAVLLPLALAWVIAG